MEELPQTPAPVAPEQPQAAYKPKHWHWPLWGGLFVASIFIGGVVYVYFQTPPTEGPASSSQLVDNHFLNQKGEKSNYILKGVQIYFVLSSYPTVTEILAEGTDPTSFRVLCEAFSDISAYAKDAGHVYFRGHILEDADSQTFQPLYNADGSCYDYYAKDNRHVYYAQKIISDSPDSFVVLSPDEELFSDGINTFQWGEIVSTTTFQTSYSVTPILDASGNPTVAYFTDGTAVYGKFRDDYDGQIIVGADPATFREFSSEAWWVARDKDNIYSHGWLVEGADPKTFSVISVDPPYFKDEDQVFYPTLIGELWPIESADPTTFVLISGQSRYDAQDKNHKYLQGEIVQ